MPQAPLESVVPLEKQCFIEVFQLKKPAFREGENSGGPKYAVHVSGDGVEVQKDGDSKSEQKAQSIKQIGQKAQRIKKIGQNIK